MNQKDNKLLLECALSSFKNILSIKYNFLFGHKNKELLVDLVFMEKNFIHLSGINKLKDVTLSLNSMSFFYRELCKKSSIRERIAKSKYFENIIERLVAIINLESNLSYSLKNSYFKFTHSIPFNYSAIEFDYLIKCNYKNDNYHYFLRETDSHEYVVISLFINNIKNYAIGQERLTLLRESFFDRRTNKEVVLYEKEERRT